MESDLASLNLWRPAFVDELGYPSCDGVLFRPYIVGDERQTWAQDRAGRWVEVEVVPMREQEAIPIA